MLTITLKTLQQQTFKIEIDPELTVSNTLEFPCPSKWATARARGTGKYRGLVVSNLNMKGDTILNHVAIHAIWEWHSVFVEVLWFYRCFLATPVFCPEMTAQYFAQVWFEITVEFPLPALLKLSFEIWQIHLQWEGVRPEHSLSLPLTVLEECFFFVYFNTAMVNTWFSKCHYALGYKLQPLKNII